MLDLAVDQSLDGGRGELAREGDAQGARAVVQTTRLEGGQALLGLADLGAVGLEADPQVLDLTLKLNGKDDRLTRRDFLALARTIGVSAGDAETAIANLTARVADRAQGLADDARSAIGGAGDAASGWVDDARSALSDAGDAASEWADDAADQLALARHRAKAQARRGWRKTRQQYRQNPLVFGLVAIAAGAALGALLPRLSRAWSLGPSEFSAMLRMRYNLYNGGSDADRTESAAYQLNKAKELGKDHLFVGDDCFGDLINLIN